MTEIQNKANLLLRYKQAYYYGDRPLVTDAEYDRLENELSTLCPTHPVLAMVGAPVPPGNMLEKAEHMMPMGSQSKVNTESEFRAWYAKNKVQSIHASLKGDGATASAIYQDGKLIQVITRGDGSIGEDITFNGAKFKGVPLWLESKGRAFTGAIRFEGILTLADWQAVDPTKTKNARNAGNGIMRRKSGEHADLITAFAFDIIELIDGIEELWISEDEKTRRLVELGFPVLESASFTRVDDAIGYFESVTMRRKSLPAMIDGVVFKINDVAMQVALGIADGRPKGQVSWKFEAEGAETVLTACEITGGHTGALIPNARFSPVEIGGTTVCNASLSNFDEVERLGIAVGDTVLCVKANDIIPKIIQVLHRPADRKPIERPTACPFCGGAVGYKAKADGDDGVVLVCLNQDCSSKTAGKIQRWITSLDIQGIGDVVLEALMDRMGVRDAADLYVLHERRPELAAMMINAEKGMVLGEKRANTIIDAIDAKRHMTIDQFLGSLGIFYLGKRRVELMAKSAKGDLDSLQQWQAGRLRDAAFARMVGVPEVGAQIQDGIDAAMTRITKLVANGVSITSQEKPDTSGMTTVCITGKLHSGKKKTDYFSALEAKGIMLVDEVSKGLDYLVMADPGSSSTKSVKAQKLGVKIISEEQLIEMCN